MSYAASGRRDPASLNRLGSHWRGMPHGAGVWLDRAKATIVHVAGGEVRVVCIESGAEPQFRVSGGSRSKTAYGPQQVVSEQKQEEKLKHQLRRYYRRILEEMRDAEAILVLGPGEAKIGLEKEIREIRNLSGRLRAVKTADRMTDQQLVARIKEFFAAES